MKVRMLGNVQGGARSGARVEMLVDAFCKCFADACRALEVRDASTHHALQTTEVPQEGAPLGGSKARHGLEHGLTIPFCALATVPGDGESVGFIAHALNEP